MQLGYHRVNSPDNFNQLRPNSINLAGRKPGRRLAWRARAGRRQVGSMSRTRSKTTLLTSQVTSVTWPVLTWPVGSKVC